MESQLGGIELKFHLNENKLNMNSSWLEKNSNDLKTITNNCAQEVSSVYVNDFQYSDVNNLPVDSWFTVPDIKGHRKHFEIIHQ